MKKEFNKGEVVELDVALTAGGIYNNKMADSDYYYDSEQKCWKRNFGTSDANWEANQKK